MKGDRDGLLDRLMLTQARLYRAQTILLDTFALLDDLDAYVGDRKLLDLPVACRITSVMAEAHLFLETVPWERDPAGDEAVDHFPELKIADVDV